MSFNCKRDEQGDIEERKARGSVRGDIMKPTIYFDPQCTSAPMVNRVAVRIVLKYSVQNGWLLEHMDIHSAFINERYKFEQPVYIMKPPRADGSYKHGRTTGILELNLCRNPSATYYFFGRPLRIYETTGVQAQRPRRVTCQTERQGRYCDYSNSGRRFPRSSVNPGCDGRVL